MVQKLVVLATIVMTGIIVRTLPKGLIQWLGLAIILSIATVLGLQAKESVNDFLFSFSSTPILLTIIYIFILICILFSFTSARIVRQGKQVLVERLGRYRNTLKPGLHFIIPLIDKIVWEDTTREQLITFSLQDVITRDNSILTADVALYWQIQDLAKIYYGVKDAEGSLVNLVKATLRSAFGRMYLDETYTSRAKINQELLEPMDEATSGFGMKVTRAEINHIILSEETSKALAKERTAESQKRSIIRISEAIIETYELIGNFFEHENREVPSKILELLIEKIFTQYTKDIVSFDELLSSLDSLKSSLDRLPKDEFQSSLDDLKSSLDQLPKLSAGDGAKSLDDLESDSKSIKIEDPNV